MIHAGSLEQQIRFSASEIQRPQLLDDTPGLDSIHPAILAGLFGVGALNIAYADGDQVCATSKIIMGILFGYTLHWNFISLSLFASENFLFCRVLALLNLHFHPNLLQVMRTWKKLQRKNGSELKSCLKEKECAMVLIQSLLLLLRDRRLVPLSYFSLFKIIFLFSAASY